MSHAMLGAAGDFVDTEGLHQAVSQLEHADWLTSQDRAEETEPLLTEAHQTFERLQATPWLEWTAQLLATQREAEAPIR
jgi:hypothetical protein